MSQRLQSLSDQQFNDIMSFMYSLQEIGFTNEFDNSLVMRMIWLKMREIEMAVGHSDGVYMRAVVQTNPIHKTDLIVTFYSKHAPETTRQMVLFERDERIAVSTNVITEEVKPIATDIPVAGTTLYWFEALTLFKANARFNKIAHRAFKAVYTSIAPKENSCRCRLHIRPTPRGWQVEYRVDGNTVLEMHYTFTA